MGYLLTMDQGDDVLEALRKDYRVYAPKRFPQEGRYSDTDMIRYAEVESFRTFVKRNFLGVGKKTWKCALWTVRSRFSGVGDINPYYLRKRGNEGAKKPVFMRLYRLERKSKCVHLTVTVCPILFFGRGRGRGGRATEKPNDSHHASGAGFAVE